MLIYSRVPGIFRNYKTVHPSSTSCLPLCFTAAGTVQGRPPPRRAAAGHLLLRPPPHATPPRPSWTHSSQRWTPPPLATPPRRAPRPPPRRRRGQLAAEPQLPNLRAPQYQEQSRFTFPSLPRPLPAHNPQNISADRPNASELELTVAPHLQTTSAHADPTNSFALSSRSSPTPPRPLLSTRAPSPPLNLRRRRPARSGLASSDHLPSRQVH